MMRALWALCCLAALCGLTGCATTSSHDHCGCGEAHGFHDQACGCKPSLGHQLGLHGHGSMLGRHDHFGAHGIPGRLGDLRGYPPYEPAPSAMSAAAVAYPYYTNRGPRDFLRNNPGGIGP